MKWFRTNIRHGSRLALLALAVQFVLTFGHVHAVDARIADTPLSIATETIATSTEQQPGVPDTNPAADQCPICAVMVLAGTVLLATPPVLLLPDAIELLYLTTDAEFVHLNSARVAFQPRAPPAP